MKPKIPTGPMSPTKCDRCGTVWHSSQRQPGDRCDPRSVTNKKGRACRGICR